MAPGRSDAAGPMRPTLVLQRPASHAQRYGPGVVRVGIPIVESRDRTGDQEQTRSASRNASDRADAVQECLRLRRVARAEGVNVLHVRTVRLLLGPLVLSTVLL